MLSLVIKHESLQHSYHCPMFMPHLKVVEILSTVSETVSSYPWPALVTNKDVDIRTYYELLQIVPLCYRTN